MVATIGARLLFRRRRAAGRYAHDHSDHVHAYPHDSGGAAHDHGAGVQRHDSLEAALISPRGLVARGVSGGLLSCPSTFVVLLASFALQRVAFAIVLVIAISVGLTGVLIAPACCSAGPEASSRASV